MNKDQIEYCDKEDVVICDGCGWGFYKEDKKFVQGLIVCDSCSNFEKE